MDFETKIMVFVKNIVKLLNFLYKSVDFFIKMFYILKRFLMLFDNKINKIRREADECLDEISFENSLIDYQLEFLNEIINMIDKCTKAESKTMVLEEVRLLKSMKLNNKKIANILKDDNVFNVKLCIDAMKSVN